MTTSTQNGRDVPENPNTISGYRICVKGNLSPEMVDWLDNDIIVKNLDTGEALLLCPTADQAALHGLLNRLFNLGVFILSLRCCTDGKETERVSQ